MPDRNPITLIGLDLETTALDPARGDIIEVAAIRYSWPPDQTSAEPTRFVRLCHPRGPVSAETTALTGITNALVADAPAFSEILEELRTFIGHDFVFAHNASFDIGWLAYNGLYIEKNKVLDTFLVAAVAWPEAESYNLGALYRQLGAPRKILPSAGSRGEHSAEYDVEMAWVVLGAAQRELAVSPETYKDITELLERTELEHYVPLFSTSPLLDKERSPRYSGAGEVPRTTNTSPTPSPKLGEGNVADILGRDGILAQRWPGFTPREPQLQMATIIEKKLQEGGSVLIEAPTGSGKTLAYLTPLFFSSLSPARKAIISTYTKHLQDQLLIRDVPALQEALGTSLSVSALKGRRNYLCTRRLALAWERSNLSAAETLFLIKARLWLERGGSGDLDHLNTSHQGESLALHADSVTCRSFCARFKAEEGTGCPYQRALQQAEAAHVLIVNHALLADPGFPTRWPLGPVIIDEAHHLEEALRQASAAPLQPWHLRELLTPLLDASASDQVDRHVILEAKELMDGYTALCAVLGGMAVPDSTGPENNYALVRLTPTLRRGRKWGILEKKFEHWSGRCKFLIGLLESRSAVSPNPLGHLISTLTSFLSDVTRLVGGSDNRIQWVEVEAQRGPRKASPRGQQVYVNDVALDIVPQLHQLYEAASAVVLTSATLTISGSFGYTKAIVGLPEAEEVVLPSSFPLADNLLIYLVDDAPDPRRDTFDSFSTTIIAATSQLLRGRTLALFTSFKSLNATFNKLIRPLNKANIRLYAQGKSGGKSNMLRRFHQEAESVLLGTDSFWEGIDVPGNTLSCVIIPRLPFASPRDPILQALADARGVPSFEISLPAMLLKLRQGVGRLIRRSEDRGVVIILDPRLHRAHYGEHVLQSLPPGRIKIGSAHNLTSTIEQWIGKDVLERWRVGEE